MLCLLWEGLFLLSPLHRRFGLWNHRTQRWGVSRRRRRASKKLSCYLFASRSFVSLRTPRFPFRWVCSCAWAVRRSSCCINEWGQCCLPRRIFASVRRGRTLKGPLGISRRPIHLTLSWAFPSSHHRFACHSYTTTGWLTMRFGNKEKNMNEWTDLVMTQN